MPIIIKKGGGARVETAPLVEDPVIATFQPKQQTLDWWTKHGLEDNPKIKECAYCGKPYYVPCTEEQHARCQNFKFLSGKAASR